MRGEEAAITRAKGSGRGAGNDAAIEAAVGRAVERILRARFGNADQMREKVEALSGERGGNGAVKVSQISALVGGLPADPTSRAAAGDPPTKAEYDALVNDVHAIFAAFNALRSLL